MAKKKMYLIVDVETANGLDNPLVYDLGFVVRDRQGKIYYKQSFCIKEIFGDLRLMHNAYYSNKFQLYVQKLVDRNTTYVTWRYAMQELAAVIAKYNITTKCAYNLLFDNRAIKNTCEKLNVGNPFDLYKMDDLCIWSFACEVLYNQKFIKLAIANGWVTEKGNIRTSAEMGYRFISQDMDFQEAHTGLEDCLIESELLTLCFKQNKAHKSGIIAHPWRIVAERREKMEEKLSKPLTAVA